LQAKKKVNANDSKNWNSLFMKTDTVVESISKQMNLKKNELLDRDADNMAVRIALGEAELIKQTKEDLEKEGIDFDSKNERSKTMILIKNLPKDTTERELQELFSQSGSISRIVIPRSQTIALVEFNEPSEARSAFRFFAFKTFKHIPLFLGKESLIFNISNRMGTCCKN
jgi:multiple RNA-binding domain-containing protein 1